MMNVLLGCIQFLYFQLFKKNILFSEFLTENNLEQRIEEEKKSIYKASTFYHFSIEGKKINFFFISIHHPSKNE
jgi:hypothetical protein